MTVAYDWAGSSTGDPRDAPLFDKIFTDIGANGKTLFATWISASTEDKEALVNEVERILRETRWLSSYKGSIKAQIRQVCQSNGAKAILVRIDGGPITRVEARMLPSLIAEAKTDLASLGFTEVDIELHAFETLQDFLHDLPRFYRMLRIRAATSNALGLTKSVSST